MYESLIPTTELEAVNAMLDQIGEAPVSALTDLALDAAKARNTLNRVSREVQARGWHWNTTLRKLTKDGNNEFVVPTNALRIDTTRNSIQYDVINRGGKLFDRRPFKNTTVFTDLTEIEVEMIELLAFTDLPEAVRQYIYIRAARQFQEFQLGAQSISQFSSDDEAFALATILDAEIENGDYNYGNNELIATSLSRSPIGFRRF